MTNDQLVHRFLSYHTPGFWNTPEHNERLWAAIEAEEEKRAREAERERRRLFPTFPFRSNDPESRPW